MKLTYPLLLLGSLSLASCSTVAKQADEKTALLSGAEILCETSAFAIQTGYITSRANECSVTSDESVTLTIRPEAMTDPAGQPINNSPWYGFHVVPRTSGQVEVQLDYIGGRHRYEPKISFDGKSWSLLDADQITEKSETSVGLNLILEDNPFFVSAQAIMTPADHDEWTGKIGERSDATVSVFGESARGYPLKQIEIQTNPDVEKPYVVLVGRQHPPEITGAQALNPYAETILNGSELSNQFLDHFNLLIIPMINPDGVKDGNWRFATGGMDLNRDWGPFTQPETRAVREAFERFHSGEDEVAIFLDFHSTWRNLLYTQTDEEPTVPPMFTRDWVAAVEARLDSEVYPFTRDPRPLSERAISKNYMYRNFGVPSITYEVGDRTPKPANEDAARVFAEEMMKIFLDHKDKS